MLVNSVLCVIISTRLNFFFPLRREVNLYMWPEFWILKIVKDTADDNFCFLFSPGVELIWQLSVLLGQRGWGYRQERQEEETAEEEEEEGEESMCLKKLIFTKK